MKCMTQKFVIRGGLLIDGTGAPARSGDVRVEGDRITAVGEVDLDGADEVDATGCWVTPGFIDPHTHLDAQLCWDPSGSPGNRHGVTTVVLGLCGFGVAPCPEGGDEYLLKALEVVERGLDSFEDLRSAGTQLVAQTSNHGRKPFGRIEQDRCHHSEYAPIDWASVSWTSVFRARL